MAYLGENTKKLGFGCMRFPKTDGVIDIEQVKVMVDKFMAAGFTYFDTAWAYEGSEEAVKAALVDRYPRESFTLATKCAAWIRCETQEDAIKQFEESLARTGAGYFDFYLLHNLGDQKTGVFEKLDLWNYFLKEKEAGRIKHLGFSMHADADQLEAVLKAHPEAEFVQLQINYADWDDNSIQSRACYEVCRKYEKPVVIMEPVKGGMLANPPETVRKVFDEAEPGSSYASWALRFAASLPGIITVLSGMSNVEQMDDNLNTMKDFTGLSEKEEATLKKAQEELSKIPLIKCTKCDYCAKVCPMDIRISDSFYAMNSYTLYGQKEDAIRRIKGRPDDPKKVPTECIQCGACESVCPQHLEIPSILENICRTFEGEL